MSINKADPRIRIKASSVVGAVPTNIGTASLDYTDGTWTVDNIYTREFYLNRIDERLWIGTDNGVMEITTASTFSSTGLKQLEIGGWNMNVSGTGSNLEIAHGFTGSEWTTFRDLNIMIYDDTQTTLYNYRPDNISSPSITSATISYIVDGGAFFDSATFSNDSINRGYITYWRA